MKPTLPLFVISVLLLLDNCAPQAYFDQSPSVNLVPFKTYAFLPKVDSAKVSIYNSGIIDELIHKSIVAELNSRGFSVDTKNPDLLVKFHMMVENKTDIVNTSPYSYPPTAFGYPMRYPYYYYPGAMSTPNSFRRIQYKEGMLIIDFFVRSDGKLGWRGWSESNLDNLNKFEQQLPDMVARILSNYPIPRK